MVISKIQIVFLVRVDFLIKKIYEFKFKNDIQLMLDIIGHFCFLIFAQGKWQEKYKTKLISEIKKDFLKYAYWDPMYDIPVKLLTAIFISKALFR